MALSEKQQATVNRILNNLYEYNTGSRSPSPKFATELAGFFQKASEEDKSAVGKALIVDLADQDGLRDDEYGPHDLTGQIALVEKEMNLAKLNGTGIVNRAKAASVNRRFIGISDTLSTLDAKCDRAFDLLEELRNDLKRMESETDKSAEEIANQIADSASVAAIAQAQGEEHGEKIGELGKVAELANKTANDVTNLEKKIGTLAFGESNVERLVAGVDKLKTKLGSAETELSEQLKTTENKLKALVSTTEEKHKLHESVTLWSTRASDHSTAYFWYSFVSLAVAAALGLISYYLVTEIEWKDHFTSELSFANAAKFGLIVFIGSLALVIFRVIMRIALSNLHLKIENENRAALASLYLHLNDQIEAKGNKELSDQQRAIVLGALFQPSTVGIIKDEGFSMDPSIAAGIAKLVSKK